MGHKLILARLSTGGWVMGAFMAGATTAYAQNPATTAAAHRFHDVALSPDGKYLAWVGALPSGGSNPPSLVMMDRVRGITSALAVVVDGVRPGSERDLHWTRDGRTLVFLASGASDGVTGVYQLAAGEASGRRIARVPGSVSAPELSPSGAEVALLYSAPEEEANGPTEATPRDTGAIDNFVDRQHLALVDVSTGTLRVVSPHDLYVFEKQWAPNGSELIASAADGSGNNNWYAARVVGISPSGQVREVARPDLQMADPQWSPDGSEIAYIGGLMSDEGATGGDLYVVPSAGGTPRDVTPKLPVSVASYAWTGPHTILLSAWANGGSAVATVNVATGTVTPLWTTDDVASSGGYLPAVSAMHDGSVIALSRESPARAPELWLGPPGHVLQLTHVNDGLMPAWGTTEHVRWHNDGMPIEGLLMAPRIVTPGKRYPMVVSVHGGPAAAWRPFWPFAGSLETRLSQEGYYVFMPNPRGSYGAGESFTRGNVKDLGYGDLRDILRGMDTVVARFPVDSQRIGITGGSYGGYMTMWAVTQTGRFRAAVSVAGLSNWLSYAGENGINRWMLAYFGGETVYDDPAVYARSAPITFINKAHTPMLIVAGERDAECPAPQSFEYWRGLQHTNTPAELIVYADEGHGVRLPAHAQDLMQRTLGWFGKYLSGPTQ